MTDSSTAHTLASQSGKKAVCFSYALDANTAIAAVFYRAMTYFLAKRLRSTTKDLGFARGKLAHRG